MIHPGALPIVAEAVRDFVISGRGNLDRQAFVTTHSPTLLDLFPPDKILWAKFSHGSTECGTIGPRQLQLIKENLFSPGELLLAEGIS